MPAETTTFTKTMRAFNARRFGKGELVYIHPGINPLWYGLSASGKPLQYTKSPHPLAGARWTMRAWENEGDIINAEMQRMIDEGVV
jgi:hypothetical protein